MQLLLALPVFALVALFLWTVTRIEDNLRQEDLTQPPGAPVKQPATNWIHHQS